MVETRAEYLWAGERYWPEQPRGLTFLVPAYERVAELKFGGEWKAGEILVERVHMPNASLAEASPIDRAVADWALSRFEDYSPELGPDPLGSQISVRPQSQFAALGASKQITEPQQVYLFSDEQWELARAVIHRENVLRDQKIARANEVSRWFANHIIDGTIVALSVRFDSGEVVEHRPEAWISIDISRISKRVRSCRMSPVSPYLSGNVGYFIYLRTAGFERALEIEATAKRRLADEYDAAQERGEIATKADQNLLPEQKKVSVAEIGLTHKDIHEARTIRDAKVNVPGILKKTRLPTSKQQQNRDSDDQRKALAIRAIGVEYRKLRQQRLSISFENMADKIVAALEGANPAYSSETVRQILGGRHAVANRLAEAGLVDRFW
ncbi:hypothetical protein [Bosea sp. PAMC 26642]|uniref:hypothetical protein n=1 Tax=Bosea sp. (strain PAMC 26642) TaxID=1792307 RepID=UPI0007701326|nr:hypothetical protein [Bosea sp. PAMC 26642]AMJ59394.1 hypothetical protein AXW83_02920 [Bosea sp. PAMC 26642]